MLVQQGRLAIRALQKSDAPVMLRWLQDERVLEFYEGRDKHFDLHTVIEVFIEDQGGTTPCLVLLNEKPLGYVQFYPLDSEDKQALELPVEDVIYGLDQFIGEPDSWGLGLGTELVSLMRDYLITEKAAQRLVLGPQSRNSRAIACYEKCGFEKLRMLPAHEMHEGQLQDCWLMQYYPARSSLIASSRPKI